MTSADHIIEHFGLQPHPEGGFYREVHRSSQSVISSVHGQSRQAMTSIYFLLKAGQTSRFHKVIHDETWHVYQGDGVRLFLMSPDGETKSVELGPVSNPLAFQFTVPANWHQAAEPLGEYVLVGCTVAPGFDFADFSFTNDDPSVLTQLPEEYRYLL